MAVLSLLAALSCHASLLSQTELKFIEQNPVVTLAAGNGFEPFIFRDVDGEPIGIDHQVTKLIEEKTGLEIRFAFDDWINIQKKLKAGTYRSVTSISRSIERESYLSFTEPYYTSTPTVIVNRTRTNEISRIEDLEGKTVALVNGTIAYRDFLSQIDDVKYMYLDTPSELLNAIAQNRADFAIVNDSLFYVINQLGLGRHIDTKFFLQDTLNLRFAFTHNNPELTSIFNKALQEIGDVKLNEIKNQWLGKRRDNSIGLTTQEKAFLSKKKHISFCVHPHWYPSEEIEDNKVGGMTDDFIGYLKRVLSVPFYVHRTSTWEESLQHANEGKCDILPLVMETPERSKKLSFTSTYLSLPLVLATRDDELFVDSLSDLAGKSIGIFKSTAYVELLNNSDLDLNIVQVNDVEEGLKLVSKGELYGVIEALPVLNYYLQHYSFGNLKISGRFDERWDLSIATAHSNSELISILEKAVNSMSNDFTREVLNKYISVKYESYLDLHVIYRVIFGAILILLLLVFYTTKVKKDKAQLEIMYKALEQKDLELKKANKELQLISYTDSLTGISNRRMLDRSLVTELNRCKRYGGTVGLILFDIDHFKQVNDTYGHQVGDEFLMELANIVNKCLRRVDIFGRWGGEEFLAILPQTDIKTSCAKAEMIRCLIESTIFEKVGHRTSSFGVSILSENITVYEALEKADRALYYAKEQGRNQVHGANEYN
ncbi:transporter substrate-binding domain-containing protein [Vibrio sp. D404a]|uniref:transporter substrate-binding domain-containing diguanylate cyclase n=1 Tax=unclassified Vibrio TaxID=2614977 RepID=UPI00255704F3|nr:MULTISPECIES: transporter substrate-binding domain-containing protein [unclassified Vibrio]MDK9735948.1 transporter substrate-binding domain-containing protein [Vibrio sp. D404a]MDK9797886.1 transporter substrate-binding domain-containing protein [Vibrio sp. D449a]